MRWPRGVGSGRRSELAPRGRRPFCPGGCVGWDEVVAAEESGDGVLGASALLGGAGLGQSKVSRHVAQFLAVEVGAADQRGLHRRDALPAGAGGPGDEPVEHVVDGVAVGQADLGVGLGVAVRGDRYLVRIEHVNVDGDRSRAAFASAGLVVGGAGKPGEDAVAVEVEPV